MQNLPAISCAVVIGRAATMSLILWSSPRLVILALSTPNLPSYIPRLFKSSYPIGNCFFVSQPSRLAMR